MAEAIALGASVVAFLQLTDRVIQVTKSFIGTVEDCPSDIRVILVEISSLKAILETLEFLQQSSSEPGPQLLQRLSEPGGPVAECHKSVADLEKVLPPDFTTVKGKRRKLMTAAEHLAWPLRETAARKLIDTISRQKASIALALTCDTSLLLRDIRKDIQSVREALTTTEINEVCSWLEFTNPTAHHNAALRAREDDTCQWMTRSTEWNAWLEKKSKCVWIHGIPGAGKTTLACFLIEKVKSSIISLGPKPTTYVYYYCFFGRAHDESTSFLRWLVGQLSRQCRQVPESIIGLFQLKHAPDISTLLSALETLLQYFETVFVVVDAVDESCPRDDLLKVIRDLVTDHRFETIRLLVTSREYYDIECVLSHISKAISMDNKGVEEDIRRYARAELQSNKRFAKWPVSLVTEVEDALAKGSKGMFRWTVCQIDVLQRLRSQADVRRALLNLPKTLDETYERVFQLLAEEDREFVRLALIIICGNNDSHPMHMPVEVLLKAIAYILDGHNAVHEDDQIAVEDYETLRDRCGCLISVTVHGDVNYAFLAHYTVKEYLYSSRIAESSVSHFALSRFKVWVPFLKLILGVVVHDIGKTETPDPGSLYCYCILSSALFDDQIRERMLADDTDAISQVPEIVDLIQSYHNKLGSLHYRKFMGEVLEMQRKVIQHQPVETSSVSASSPRQSIELSARTLLNSGWKIPPWWRDTEKSP